MSRLVGMVFRNDNLLSFTLNMSFLSDVWTRTNGVINSETIIPTKKFDLPGYQVKEKFVTYPGHFYNNESLLPSKSFFEEQKEEYSKRLKKLEKLRFSKDFYAIGQEARLDIEDEISSLHESILDNEINLMKVKQAIYLIDSFTNIIKLENEDFYDSYDTLLYIYEE